VTVPIRHRHKETAMPRRRLVLTAALTALLSALAPGPAGRHATAAPAAGCTAVALHDADINNDGDVGIADLLELLSCWGPVVLVTCDDHNLVDLVNCPNGNDSIDEVNVIDLLVLLAAWGPA
jgi:hypothetical protein